MEPKKCIQLYFLWKCFLWFFKVGWVQENQDVMFLVVPPKDMDAQWHLAAVEMHIKNCFPCFEI
jgi:hypothetical protein